MTKRMLIDASHAEETRVVVLDGNRLEDFDVETATKRQLKGNIYLAKVVRVEPSLQAAFVEYGGNRHGFLAFGEIHPDYYQIPVADRQRLIAAQEAEAEEEDDEEAAGPDVVPDHHVDGATDDEAAALAPNADGPYVPPEPAEHANGHASSEDGTPSAAELLEAGSPAQPLALEADVVSAPLDTLRGEAESDPVPEQVDMAPVESADLQVPPEAATDLFPAEASAEGASADVPSAEGEPREPATHDPIYDPASDPADDSAEEPPIGNDGELPDGADSDPYAPGGTPDNVAADDRPAPESLGGETEPRERRTPRFLRNYKIQEVIRRRQILLVQVVKEERGSKGAALTTYISLAGRYSVLMPNSPRGGGISRKITSAADRRRLKEVTQELQLPRGMGMIVRTAGAARPKAEILRDGEYLLNQWDQIRDLTMKSVAPALIYEEANLIKRTIRDVYSRDVDEVIVDGEAGWRNARDFMRMLMPAHARKVQLWREGQPLFARMQVEAQLDGMLQPTVQLRSGGYLVINQTEALVAIDVNSGRSTRERGIEETALRTNMEAAAEVARQLRLRDLAGLIVIDFIDMEQRRHNAMVERELKDALRHDRARIQVGSISHFGLMEMSRQRLRPSLAETAFVPCPHCGGTGHMRGTESAALFVLRAVEEEGAKRKAAEIVVHVSGAIALYVLNHKRVRLGEIEARYGMTVAFAADETLRAPEVRIERVRTQTAPEGPLPVSPGSAPDPRFAAMEAADALLEEAPDEAEEEEAAAEPVEAAEAKPAAAAADAGRRRRRRRRGSRRDDATGQSEDGESEDGQSEGGQAEGGQAENGRAEVEAAGEPGTMALDGVGQDDRVFGGVPETAPDAAAGAVSDTVAGPATETVPEAVLPGIAAEPAGSESAEAAPAAAADPAADDAEAGKRRGRRGGRRRRKVEPAVEAAAEEQPAAPVWTGPTPADPFGGQSFDIFDAMEMAEAQREASAAAAQLPDVVVADLASVDVPVSEVPMAEVPLAETPIPDVVVVADVSVPDAAIPDAPAVTAEAVSPPDGPVEPAGVAMAEHDPASSDVLALAASEPVTSEPTGQSSLPDLEPAVVPPPAPTPDLPVEDPLPWTTPDVAPPEEPAVDTETAAPATAEEPELALDPAEPAVKRRGWWRRGPA